MSDVFALSVLFIIFDQQTNRGGSMIFNALHAE